MSDRSLSRQTAIVGFGSTAYGEQFRNPRPDWGAIDFALEASARAIADAGLKKRDIDGLILSGVPEYESFMFRSGLTDVRFLGHYPMGGRLCPAALAHAAMAVHHDLADYVLLFNTVTFRSSGMRFGGGDEAIRNNRRPVATMESSYSLAYGMSTPGALYALAYSGYRHEFKVGEDELGHVSLSIRQWAAKNPDAIYRDPITLEDYHSARYIAEPLRLFDYCTVNDGCAAYVVTTAERANDLPHVPVLIASVAERANVREYYASEDRWSDACHSLKYDLFDRVGMSIDEIDSVQVYDNFSPAVLWVLEGFGFAEKGESLDRIAGGWIAPGGELPVNTSGGMLSEAYLQGWNNHVEAVRQLRGDAGERQIPGCRAIMYAGLSAIPAGDVLVRGD